VRISDPLDDLFHGRSHVRVLRALVGLPKGIDASTREVARRAGLSHPTASSVLDGLRVQGVVHVRRTALADEYRLNLDHVVAEQVRALIRWEKNLPQLVRSFLADSIRETAPWVDAAYLFGSAVREDMKPQSDLDVALLCPARKESQLRAMMEKLGDDTAERFGNRLHAVIGTRSLEELASPGRRGYKLWRTIAREGVPLLPERED